MYSWYPVKVDWRYPNNKIFCCIIYAETTESKPAKLETSPKGIDPSPYSECSWIYLNLLMHELHKGLVALEL